MKSVTEIQQIPNLVGGQFEPSRSDRTLPVTNPATGEVIARVPLSTGQDLEGAVEAAGEAQQEWGRWPVRERVQVLFRLKTLLEENSQHLAEVITLENGKLPEEAGASIARAVECVEFATSLPQLGAGQVLEVSRGVECKMVRFPLGVVGGITPFNFPLMVPLWMIPLALACGNAFILKPSEQTPLSAIELARLLKQAGLPEGVFSVINGDREIVEAMCAHPGIRALGFVGSTRAARNVYERATSAGKRVRALGGAKNHLVVVPDADPELAASNIVASVSGCAGQRCMAASVLLAVGEVAPILENIREKMAQIVPGRDMGPIISRSSLERIDGYLSRAEQSGTKLVLDGRQAVPAGPPTGNFMGASIVECSPTHEAACDEIFGPVLTVIRCRTLSEALAIENASPYGNAAAIYTSSGKVAQEFTEKASCGMVGVNVGVPVPREPFAFGGWNQSRFGDGDITGSAAIDFWSASKKVTTKWSAEHAVNWMS